MSRIEYVSPEGFRLDGRLPEECRRILCQLDQLVGTDGSAYVEQGHTHVLAVVRGPVDSRRTEEKGLSRIHCTLSMASFSRGAGGKSGASDGRARELSSILRQAMEGVVLRHLYAESDIHVFVEVLQTDGGVLAASLNACCLALMSAGVAMADVLTACQVGWISARTSDGG
eukprot:TRINITY_DN19232_c0_g2_i1.p1 TRINITY_DN19232_c0_g2~~TRINITY_DN19232_c0_g2_i1.p1  ORF type:complete len:171 (-),score=39.95 TRINITY_DN19232_c0_g2_i1:286-798(-)